MKRSLRALSFLLVVCCAITTSGAAFPPYVVGAEAQAPAVQTPTKLVNINSASATELTTLPGIGEKIAQAVIDHRTANGPFKATEDLKNVKGIGDAKFEAIKDMITVK